MSGIPTKPKPKFQYKQNIFDMRKVIEVEENLTISPRKQEEIVSTSPKEIYLDTFDSPRLEKPETRGFKPKFAYKTNVSSKKKVDEEKDENSPRKEEKPEKVSPRTASLQQDTEQNSLEKSLLKKKFEGINPIFLKQEENVPSPQVIINDSPIVTESEKRMSLDSKIITSRRHKQVFINTPTTPSLLQQEDIKQRSLSDKLKGSTQNIETPILDKDKRNSLNTPTTPLTTEEKRKTLNTKTTFQLEEENKKQLSRQLINEAISSKFESNRVEDSDKRKTKSTPYYPRISVSPISMDMSDEDIKGFFQVFGEITNIYRFIAGTHEFKDDTVVIQFLKIESVEESLVMSGSSIDGMKIAITHFEGTLPQDLPKNTHLDFARFSVNIHKLLKKEQEERLEENQGEENCNLKELLNVFSFKSQPKSTLFVSDEIDPCFLTKEDVELDEYAKYTKIYDLILENEISKFSTPFEGYKDDVDEVDPLMELMINPIFEEVTIVYNELYEETQFVNNPLCDQEEWFENPFFGGESNHYLEEIKPSHESMRKGIQRETNLQFTGSNFVNYLLKLTDYQICRKDAVLYGQKLMESFVFKNIKLTKKFEDSETSFYLFSEEMDSSFPPPEKTFRPAPNSYYILRDLDLLILDFIERHSPAPTSIPYKNLIDYVAIGESKELKKIKRFLFKLDKVDLSLLCEDHRKTFFIHIFNILLIIGLTHESKRRGSIMKMSNSQKNIRLIVGGYEITGELIERILLNGKKHDLSVPYDNRIHFLLHKGTVSCPNMRFYNYQNLDEDIERATREYLQSSVKFNHDEKTVSLPPILIKKEFGSTWEEKKEYLRKYEIQIQDDYKDIYQNFDFTLNQKDLQSLIQEVKLEFYEVISNPKYRTHFKNFCEKEYSNENVEAWCEIEKYHNTENPLERKEMALQFVEKYLKVDSESELNVPEKAKITIYQTIEEDNTRASDIIYEPNYQKDLFLDVKRHLEDMMVDTYVRFKKDGFNELAMEILENQTEEQDATSSKFSFAKKAKVKLF